MKKIAVLGTGMVAKSIAGKLSSLGYDVLMGTRNVTDTQTKEEFTEWMNNQKRIQLATYSNAARQVEMIVNATNGKGSLDALDMAGKENLAGKVLLDIANPLDFSNGMPPSLTVCNTSSLAEQIQQAFPDTKVVKKSEYTYCTSYG